MNLLWNCMLQSLMFQHPSFSSGLKVGTKVLQNVAKVHAFQLEQYVSNQAARDLLSKDVQGFDVGEWLFSNFLVRVLKQSLLFPSLEDCRVD